MAQLLLVDDNPAVLNLLGSMLTLVGHTVVATQDSKEALELIEKLDLGLVITDLDMPHVSGWDIAGKVKSKAANTPVILITGHAEDYASQDLSRRGIDLLLPKPITWEMLTQSVKKFV